jgi:hypothetical protein
VRTAPRTRCQTETVSSPAQPVPPAPFVTASVGHRAPKPRTPWATRDELRYGAYLALALAGLGALLGVLWQWWSPPGPIGYVIAPHAIQPDETEAFVAADGRFAVICAATGLVAGVGAWMHKPTRGPVAVLSLAVGGVLGALLTDLVGHLLAGGTSDGKTRTILRELPLSVHMRGLLVLEAAVAVLVYSLLVSFAAADDLGRGYPSVGMGDEPQLVGGGGHAPGAFQQPDLPPQ